MMWEKNLAQAARRWGSSNRRCPLHSSYLICLEGETSAIRQCPGPVQEAVAAEVTRRILPSNPPIPAPKVLRNLNRSKRSEPSPDSLSPLPPFAPFAPVKRVAVPWLTGNGSAPPRRTRSPDRDADAPWPAAGPSVRWQGAVSSPRRDADAAWLPAGRAASAATDVRSCTKTAEARQDADGVPRSAR